MPATTTLLGLVTPTQGTLSGTWGDTVNYGISDYVDIAVAGTLTLTNDGAVTLANTTGSSSGSSITSSLTGAGTVTAQFAIVNVTGTLTVAKVVTGPSYSKTYTVVNAATGGIVTFKAAGQTGVSVAVGESAFVYFNGTDYVKVAGTAAVSSFSAGTTGLTPNTATTGAVTLAGTLAVANGGTGLTAGTSGGVLAYTATGTLASSAALAASALVIGGGAGAAPSTTTTGTGVVTALGVNTGSAGAFVVNGGALGTPSSGTLTNATGLPLTTGVTGTLATTNGGTGLTSFTANGVVYASSTSALATGSALTFDGNKLAVSGSGIAGADDRIFTVTNTAANSYGAMSLVGTSRGGYLNFYNGATAQASIVGQASALTFYVGADSSGSQAMILNSTGLGIGTSSPAAKLQVNGATDTLKTYGSSYNQQIHDSVAGAFSQTVYQVNAVTQGLIGVGGGNMLINTGGNATANIIFATGSGTTERMRLDSAGNLGLGVTPSAWASPYKAMEVGFAGCSVASFSQTSMELSANAKYTAANDRFAGTGYASKYQQSAGVHRWYTSSASGTVDNIITFTQAMTLDASGNLGVGTTSPLCRATIASPNVALGARGGIYVYTTDSMAVNLGGQITFGGSFTGTDQTIFGSIAARKENSTDANTSAYLQFCVNNQSTGNAERARIDSSGNLLVGTTSLIGSGKTNVSFNGASAQGMNLQTTYADIGSGFLGFYNSAGSNIGSVTQAVGSTVLYNTTSDQRLKENIVNSPEFGSVIDSIQVRSFNWKTGQFHQRAGFIAQELVIVAPEAVHQPADPEEMMAVDYSKLVPMLVKEIQSLRKRLAAAGIA